MDERTHARYMSDIAYFLSKMEAEPNSSYFIPIALAYNKLEKYDETIAMCKTAVERFPSNCAAKTFLAEAYVYKGLFDQARDLLFDVTAEDDNNYKALKLLGIICKEKGNNTEAVKYLTGAYIRSPEDEEVRKMIEELGGTLNHSEIYDTRMKKQTQSADDSEEDEELKTYQEIDKRIRNAEIIMADLVSDTSINSRTRKEKEEDKIKETAEAEVEETLELETAETLPDNEGTSEEVTQELQEESEREENIAGEGMPDSAEDDLLSALTADDVENDLTKELQEESEREENIAGEEMPDSAEDDLLSALTADDVENDLAKELQEESEKEENIAGEEMPGSAEDDLLSALTADDVENDLAKELQEESEREEDSINDEQKELFARQVPSSINGMTYDNMIDDDFRYGSIIEENYEDSENPSVDLGDSAPFTQSDIMDEILSAVGMTSDDMADDERIDISEKDRKLMRLENFLDKVQQSREDI